MKIDISGAAAQLALSKLIGWEPAQSLFDEPNYLYAVQHDGIEFIVRCKRVDAKGTSYHWRIDVSKERKPAFAIYKDAEAICWVWVNDGPQLPIGRPYLMVMLHEIGDKPEIQLLLELLELMGVDTSLPQADAA